MGNVLELRPRDLSSEPSLYAAYDYEENEWIKGEEALHLLIKQTLAEIKLLSDPVTATAYWETASRYNPGKSCHEYKVELHEQVIRYLDILICCLELPAVIAEMEGTGV